MANRRNAKEAATRKMSGTNPRTDTKKDTKMKTKRQAHLKLKSKIRNTNGNARRSDVKELKTKLVMKRQKKDTAQKNNQTTVKQTTKQAKQLKKQLQTKMNDKATRENTNAVNKRNKKQCNNTTKATSRKSAKKEKKQACKPPIRQPRATPNAIKATDGRIQRVQVPTKLKVFSRMSLPDYAPLYFSFSASLNRQYLLVGNCLTKKVEKIEVPSGRLVWSSPLPNDVWASCTKMHFPNGETMLFFSATTYILDVHGKLRYTHEADQDDYPVPDGVVSWGVVYKTKDKDGIRIRQLEDHKKILCLPSEASDILVCEDPQDGKIAIVDKNYCTIEIFSRKGDLIVKTKLKYSPAYYKSMVTFNNVIAITDCLGKVIHLHSWTNGREVGLLHDFGLGQKEKIWGVGASRTASDSIDDPNLMDVLHIWVNNDEVKWHKVISFKMSKFISVRV